MASKLQVQAAIDAGYWITKDHGKWNVGYDISTILSRGHATKAAARTAMVEAHKAATELNNRFSRSR